MSLNEIFSTIEDLLSRGYVAKAIGPARRRAVEMLYQLAKKTYGSGVFLASSDLSLIVRVGNILTKFTYKDEDGKIKCIICGEVVSVDPPELVKHFSELHFPVLQRVLKTLTSR